MVRVHFTGIKGVGMTALALAGQDRGWQVQGSDSKEKQITDEVLESHRIPVFTRFTPRNISVIEKSRWKPNIDQLIYTGAHHGVHNVEPTWAISRGIPTNHYAAALGNFFSDKQQVCVCGVGGKTTTTAMLATIFRLAGLKPSWVVGTSHIASLPAPGRWDSEGEWAVIESDEYVADPIGDRTPKFLFLKPKIILCTNIRYDHPDVFDNFSGVIDAYLKFFRLLPVEGRLVVSQEAFEVLSEHNPSFVPKEKRLVVVNTDSAQVSAVRRTLVIAGEHNVRNALLALTAAELAGVSFDQGLESLRTFTGLRRRFEHIASINGVELFDDYAHHPVEIRALTEVLKRAFPPPNRIRFIFHPHTFSRTKALFDEFVDSLTDLDEVITVPIFPSARERQDGSVNSDMLARSIVRQGGNATYIEKRKKLLEYLCHSAKPGDVIITVGAGDIYTLHEDLKKCLTKPQT